MTALDNRTPWAVALLAVADAEGRPLLTVAVEATIGLDGAACDEQPAICLEGAWDGDPATGAPREPPCSPLPKRGTDCLLRGSGVGREVVFAVGPVAAQARLCGPRTWVRTWRGIRPGPEGVFVPVPLAWERAAGPQPANPVGCGLATGPFREGVALPQIEDPAAPLTRWGSAAPPPGFAATTPAWGHRAGLDPFDPAAANVAPPALIAAGGLRGDEIVRCTGCAGGPLHGDLPGLAPPRLRLARRQGDLRPEARLDTVLVDAGARTLRLTWRATAAVGEWAAVDAVAVG